MKRALLVCWVSLWAVQAVAQHTLEHIVQLIGKGEVTVAERLLNENLSQDAEDVDSRVLLGAIVNYGGNADDAVQIWTSGLTYTQADYPLYMSIGEVRMLQAEEYAQMHRSSMLPIALSQEQSSPARTQYLQLAEEAFTSAHELYPFEEEPMSQLAHVYEQMGNHSQAEAQWAQLARMFPSREDFLVAQALCALKNADAETAAELIARAKDLNPRYPELYKAQARYWRLLGNEAEAQTSEQQADFYAWVPEFCDLSFGQEHYQFMRTLAKADQAAKNALLQNWLHDKSAEATYWLAAVCWYHYEDAQVEEELMDELARRSFKGFRLLAELARHSTYPTVVAKACEQLVSRQVPGTLEILVNRLPEDRQSVSTMNIAYLMSLLGDDSAVPYLIKELKGQPNEWTEEADALNLQESEGQVAAQNRAALALAYFDLPEVRQHLEEGLKSPDTKAACAAALYRLTLDARFLEPLKQMAQQNQQHAEVAMFLKNIGTKAAVKIAQRLE